MVFLGDSFSFRQGRPQRLFSYLQQTRYVRFLVTRYLASREPPIYTAQQCNILQYLPRNEATKTCTVSSHTCYRVRAASVSYLSIVHFGSKQIQTTVCGLDSNYQYHNWPEQLVCTGAGKTSPRSAPGSNINGSSPSKHHATPAGRVSSSVTKTSAMIRRTTNQPQTGAMRLILSCLFGIR